MFINLLKNKFSQRITLIKGISSGPELANSVCNAIKALNLPIEVDAIDNLNLNNDSCIKMLMKNKFIFAGNVGEIEKHSNENLKLYKLLNLYAYVVHFKSLPNTNNCFKDIDTVIIRENLEGEYSLVEHEITPGTFQSIKLITEKNSTQIANFAVKFMKEKGRKKLSAIHKANIMKKVDGLFLNCLRDVISENPDIDYNEVIVDNCCMQGVKNPQQFDTMIAPNLFGGIIMAMFSGLIGGPGLEKGWYYGDNYQMYSQGMRLLGSKMIGKSNPTGSLLSAADMFRNMGFQSEGDILEQAILNVYKEGEIIQKSAGGKSTKKEFEERVFSEINSLLKNN